MVINDIKKIYGLLFYCECSSVLRTGYNYEGNKKFLLYPKHCIMLQRINDLQRHSESSINNLKNNQDTKKKLGNISKIVRY